MRNGSGYWRVEELDTVTSTQDLLRERLDRGEGIAGLVLRARRQTAGRGRSGRDWQSGAGGSWQSAGIGPDQFTPHPGVALWIAVGIAEALNLAGAGIDLKWPNDLLLADTKVGGILTESTRGQLLVGVGINVLNQPPEGFSALRFMGMSKVQDAVLEGILAGVRLAGAAEASLAERYARLDALSDREVRVMRGTTILAGTANGVDETGRLLLGQAGRITPVESGTVRLRQSDD